jgi:general secretion pathway protein K
VGRTGVSVRFRSEGARIDLNAAPADLLSGLFTAVGVDSARAETFADRVVGWRTKAATGADANAAGAGTNAAGGGANATSASANVPGSDANAGGAGTNAAGANANPAGAGGAEDKAAKEDKLYSEQHMPYPPRHAPFDNALELSLLPGISLAVVERVLPFVTVFSGRGDVDVASADPTVLSALPQMTPQILGAVLNVRVSDPGDGRALLELLGPAKAHATAEASKAFRASIVVDFDNGRHVHPEVVFRLNDQGAKDQGANNQGDEEPYELLYWRDDFDGPMQSA